MKHLSIAALAAVLLASATASTALAADRCKDGTAPAGWLRPGGYCSIANSTADHSGQGGSPSSSFWGSYHGSWKDFPAWNTIK